jgi:hypothetical protein
MTGRPEKTSIEKNAEDVLLSNSENDRDRLLICSLFEDQRPLKGAAGLIDWRLRGFLSHFVVNGKISGRYEELTFVPIQVRDQRRKLLLVGLGSSREAAGEETAAAPILKKMTQTVKQLNISKVAISISSFPFWNEARLRKAFSDVDVEFVQ